MTYKKSVFVFVSGLVITAFMLFCMINKMFFLKDLMCGLVLFQISLLGYLVFVTIKDIMLDDLSLKE